MKQAEEYKNEIYSQLKSLNKTEGVLSNIPVSLTGIIKPRFVTKKFILLNGLTNCTKILLFPLDLSIIYFASYNSSYGYLSGNLFSFTQA